MKRIFLYIVFISIVTIFGCDKRKATYQSAETLSFNFNKETLTYDDIFRNTEFVQLETNIKSLISTISQIEVIGDKLFILDWKLNTISVFDSSGRFINNVGNIGNGPGEFIRPRYFFLNRKEKLIKVFDAPTKKLIVYDYTGKFIKEIRFNTYLVGIGENISGYWGFCKFYSDDNISTEESDKIKFITFSHDGKKSQVIKGERRFDNINISNAYIINDNIMDVSFVEPFSPDIYHFTNNEISIKYKIDYSGHFLSNRVKKRITNIKPPFSPSDKKIIESLGKESASFFSSFIENEKWLLLTTPFKTRTLIFNKTSKRTYEFSSVFLSEECRKIFFTPCCIVGDTLYSQADYNNIKDEIIFNKSLSTIRKKKLELLLQKMKINNTAYLLQAS